MRVIVRRVPGRDTLKVAAARWGAAHAGAGARRRPTRGALRAAPRPLGRAAPLHDARAPVAGSFGHRRARRRDGTGTGRPPCARRPWRALLRLATRRPRRCRALGHARRGRGGLPQGRAPPTRRGRVDLRQLDQDPRERGRGVASEASAALGAALATEGKTRFVVIVMNGNRSGHSAVQLIGVPPARDDHDDPDVAAAASRALPGERTGGFGETGTSLHGSAGSS